MSSIDTLQRRLNALQKRLEQQREPQEVIFITYWGDEEIPIEPGEHIFRTEWGAGALDNDEESQ